MPFKRGSTWSLYVPQQAGGSVIRGTGTSDRRLAVQMERMVQLLKDRREWELLAALVDGGGRTEKGRKPRLSVGELYDAYATDALEALRARLRDVDLEPFVEAWAETLRARFAADRSCDTAAMYPAQVRTLIPEGEPFLRSSLTVERINRWLAGLTNLRTGGTLSTGTRLRYHSALSSFCGHLVAVGVLESNPVRYVKAPSASKARMRYLTREEMLGLIAAQPAPFNLISALAHCGVELGAILALRRRDVDLARRTVFAHGTKTKARAREVYVMDFALPLLEAHVTTLLPNAPLFDGIEQRTARVTHKSACRALGLEDYRIHDARHTFAVWAIQQGIPAEHVARQLGHTNTKITMAVYARFQSTAEDRAAVFARAERASSVDPTAAVRGA